MELEKFKKLISQSNKIALDSAVFIYFLENNPKFGGMSEAIFELAENDKLKIACSLLISIEVLTGYRKVKDEVAEHKFKSILKDFSNIEIHDFPEKLVNQTANLRVKYNIKTPDAIHLATAIEHKADFFITNDKQLKNVKEIKVLYLGDYL